MYRLFNGPLKYLFLVPITLLIAFTLFYIHTIIDISVMIGESNITDIALTSTLSQLTTITVVQVAITFLINTAFVVLLSYLGVIYKSRSGPKWRTDNK